MTTAAATTPDFEYADDPRAYREERAEYMARLWTAENFVRSLVTICGAMPKAQLLPTAETHRVHIGQVERFVPHVQRYLCMHRGVLNSTTLRMMELAGVQLHEVMAAAMARPPLTCAWCGEVAKLDRALSQELVCRDCIEAENVANELAKHRRESACACGFAGLCRECTGA